MNWLLKIAEGPMKGAEIALVGGMRIRVGASSACDVVIADATLGDVAFELDVADERVTLIEAGGSAREMRPFTIYDFGTTAVALGPADGPWDELVRPEPEEKPEEPAAPEEPAETEPSTAEDAAAESPAEDVPGTDAASEPESAPGEAETGKRCSRGCLWAVSGILLLLLLAAGIVWFVPSARAFLRGRWSAWTERGAQTSVAASEAKPTLDGLAKEHGLSVSETNGVKCLSGNLRKRTERLAIRAFALGVDPRTQFDLTDDETLCASSSALLFACADGAIKAVSASNRVVRLEGYAPNASALERAVRALNADVKGIAALDTAGVMVGGQPPPAVSKTPFVKETVPLDETGTVQEVVFAKAAEPSAKPRPPNFPIAGILTAPYPCVIMRNGLRVTEGAQIGPAILVKIEADQLTLKDGDRTFTWKP